MLERPEVLEENRFLAARDGMDARLLDPVRERLVPARLQLDLLLEACLPHAHALGCAEELPRCGRSPTASGRRASWSSRAARSGLPGLVSALAALFTSHAPPGPDGEPVAWREEASGVSDGYAGTAERSGAGAASTRRAAPAEPGRLAWTW